jgi:hypothetical protein
MEPNILWLVKTLGFSTPYQYLDKKQGVSSSQTLSHPHQDTLLISVFPNDTQNLILAGREGLYSSPAAKILTRCIAMDGPLPLICPACDAAITFPMDQRCLVCERTPGSVELDDV